MTSYNHSAHVVVIIIPIIMDRKKRLERAIAESGEVLGYSSMKEKQIEAISALVEGNDTFVSLPTGCRKSIIYVLLPLVFDKLSGKVFTILNC